MKFVDIFCGVGGLSYGLRQAGFELKAAADSWQDAMKIHRANNEYRRKGPRPTKGRIQLFPSYSDLSSYDARDVADMASMILDQKPDMIVGGPPCQDFSLAGSQVETERGMLSVWFAMTTAVVQPEWFLMENVPGALRSFSYFETRKVLKNVGYGLSEVVCNASHYGVPQMRKRAFIIGRLGEADGFLDSAVAAAKSDQPMTIRQALGDDVGVHPGPGYPEEARAFFIRPFSGGRGVRSIDEVCPTITRNAWEGPSKGYRPNKNDFAPVENVRPLTFDELARIQGFPADWDWSAIERFSGEYSRTHALANAVPPPLAQAIGQVIMDRHHGRSIPAIEPKFKKWLKTEKGYSPKTLANRLSQLNTARKLIKGRILDDAPKEIVLLEASPAFQEFSASRKSDLRFALRLHAEWREPFRGLADAEQAKLVQWIRCEDLSEQLGRKYLRELAMLQKKGIRNALEVISEKYFWEPVDHPGEDEDHDDDDLSEWIKRREKRKAVA